MNYNHETKAVAQAEQNEPYLIVRMIGIIDQAGPIIRKDRLGIVECDAVLAGVRFSLRGGPLES